jgi:predicted nucleotidyltransferase
VNLPNELDVVRDVSNRLNKGGFKFMLTGSMAMNHYAIPRMTRDIDIVLELAHMSVDSLIRAFTPDYYIASEAVRGAVAHHSMFNAIHHQSLIKVDFIIRKPTDYRRAEFGRRQRIVIEGFSTEIVSKEDLILSKLVWAKDSRSELQLGDVRNLLQTGYDRAYIELWAEHLGITHLLRECMHD